MKLFTKLFIFSLLIICPTFVLADNSFPSFPMAFWGTAKINGSSMPTGTVVRAYYGSVLAGSVTIQESGVYGYTQPTKQKLIVGEGTGQISFTFQSTSFNSGLETSGCVDGYDGFVSGLTVEKNLIYTTRCGSGSGGPVIGEAIPPVITLIGENVTIYKGSTYTDAGATASDNADGNITGNIVTVNPVNTNTVGTYAITYNVSDAAGNHAVQVTRTVDILSVSSSSQLLSGNTTVETSNPEILVGDNNTTSSIITIPSSVTNATINVSAITTSTENSTTATIQAQMNINASTAIGAVKVEIPAGIQIMAGIPTWNGIINVPQIKENSTVTATPDSGKTAIISSVIEVGYGDLKLTFDKAVRILIAGQAGKDVGYSRSGVFTKITNVCSADTQSAGDALGAEGDCKIDIGSDLVIWTKHFTKFATYTQTITPVSTPSGSSGGGGGGTYTPPVVALTTTKKGDANGDNKVDKYDFSLMMSNWGKTGTSTSDFNNDSKVDKYDFALLMSNWGL